MVQRAMKFGPEALLSAPRRSAGVPNASGTKVLYTTSAYDFHAHKKTIELRVLNVKSGESVELTHDDDISSINWLNEDDFACLQSEKDGTTSLYVASVNKTIEKQEAGSSYYVAGKIDAAAANLKVCALDEHGDAFAIVLSAEANPDGSFFTKADAERRTHSTGRLYDSLFVRHWDRYETREKNALFYGKLSRKEKSQEKYQLSKLSNALHGTGLECPIRPFGGTDNFDVKHNAIIFVAKDPDLNPALNVKTNVYIQHLDSWSQEHPPKLQRVVIPGFEGASTCPVFSKSDNKGAFLSMKMAGYEADRNRVFIISDVNDSQNLTITQHIAAGGETEASDSWDRSPSSICFTTDGRSLLMSAEDQARSCLFMLTADLDYKPGDLPIQLTEKGYVNDMQCLSDGRVFVSGSSLVDNSWYAIVDPRELQQKGTSSIITWSHSLSADGNKFGLHPGQVSSIWTPANNPKITKKVHSLVVRPSSFDKSKDKKYPVAYLIHGGPQGSWGDSWSTRWNAAIFAEQGYIVIAPNPTGSTGYGQKFTDAIRANWGGDPYEDIVKVFEWVGENIPEADNERAVALGASYGGYMMNWIQGHDLGRKFKALVCHDGILTMSGAMLPSDEIYFPFHDLGGTPWYDPGFKVQDERSAAAQGHRNFGPSTFADWRRWDPSEYLENWATPQLVIHSELDYRLTISEGLAAFNVLQARGVDSQFLTFPDENHWVLKPENSLVWHKVVLNWINKYAGLPAYTEQDPNGEDFWGGVKDKHDEPGGAEMPIQGKPET